MSKSGVAADSKACEYGLFVARSSIEKGPGDWNFFDFFEFPEFVPGRQNQ